MKRRSACLATVAAFAAHAALAAEPVRIGVDTPLSGMYADRGQSEQYAVELALQGINEAGGVLGRPVEAFYADNGNDEAKGIAGVKRLVDQDHVSAILGALATPVTHAIMPVVKELQVPLIIDISAGQDFVDASGAGGNEWVFKTIPSDKDIAEDLVAWLKKQGAKDVAVVVDDAAFNKMNSDSFTKAAAAGGLKVVVSEVVAKGTTDLTPLLAKLKSSQADHVVLNLSTSTGPFFKAYEQSGWTVPVTGRIDFATAMGAVSPSFVSSGGLGKAAGIVVYTPAITSPGVQGFVKAYQAKYGLMPTQRSFYAYESALLVVDAIKHAGSDKPADVRAALTKTAMPSLLGGTYTMDDHNHPHTPMQMVGVRDGKVVVIGDAS